MIDVKVPTGLNCDLLERPDFENRNGCAQKAPTSGLNKQVT